MPTFDCTFLLLILAGWISAVGQWLSRSIRKASSSDIPAEAIIACLWSVGSAAPLVAFYLRVPVMSNRYMLDFAASFAAAIVALLFMAEQFLQARPKSFQRVSLSILAGCLVWLGREIICVRSEEMFLSRPATKAELRRHAGGRLFV